MADAIGVIVYFAFLLVAMTVFSLAWQRLFPARYRPQKEIELRPHRDFSRTGGFDAKASFFNWPVAGPLFIGLALVYFFWVPVVNWAMGY